MIRETLTIIGSDGLFKLQGFRIEMWFHGFLIILSIYNNKENYVTEIL